MYRLFQRSQKEEGSLSHLVQAQLQTVRQRIAEFQFLQRQLTQVLHQLLTPEQFAIEIQRIMDNPSASKRLARGRQAYWHEDTGTVVIVDPNAIDGGTAFKPASGKTYYEHVK